MKTKSNEVLGSLHPEIAKRGPYLRQFAIALRFTSLFALLSNSPKKAKGGMVAALVRQVRCRVDKAVWAMSFALKYGR